MDETEYRLETSAQVTIAANGTGSILNVGPVQQSERWAIKFLSANGTARAKLQVIRGNTFDASRQLDVTNRADGDSSNTDIDLRSGETISFWWTGGTSGAIMTCSVSGSRYVRGRRAY